MYQQSSPPTRKMPCNDARGTIASGIHGHDAFIFHSFHDIDGRGQARSKKARSPSRARAKIDDDVRPPTPRLHVAARLGARPSVISMYTCQYHI